MIKVNCQHWIAIKSLSTAGRCDLYLGGGHPGFGYCFVCKERLARVSAISEVFIDNHMCPVEALKILGKAGLSFVKTTLHIDIALVEIVKERLIICKVCSLVILNKRGEVGTCGKLTDMFKASSKSCGCFLRQKTLDSKQHCPLGKWPDDYDREGKKL